MRAARRASIYCSMIVLFLALIVPCSVYSAPTLINAEAPDLPEQARGVPMGGALSVFDLQLEQYGTTTLELQRISVFAPDATIEVVNGPSVPVPTVAYFRGRADNDPDSFVMFAVPEKGKGKAHGVITGASGTWMLESKPGSSGLKTRKVNLETELAGRTFECGADGLKVSGTSGSSGLSAALGLPVDITYTAHMIIDTDYEFWQKFWNMPGNTGNPGKTAAAAIEYVGDLIAYASTAYEREVDTNLLIQQIRLFATNSDPYTANTNACGCTDPGKLQEVRAAWIGDSTPRTLVHFISGKTEGCGCAYIGSLCDNTDRGYGASSSIGTGFNIDNPGFLWEGMVVAHEIGHNFNSPHTHGYCTIAGIADPVDVCAAAEGACAAFATLDLPGLDSLTGGVSADHPGTIMSYCHQQPGGFGNIAHTFGEFHPYGKAPWRVPDRMFAHVQSSAACMSLEYTGPDLRVVKDCKPDDPMLVGDTATCTITVENLGSTTALGAVAVDQYLSNGTFSFGTITLTKGSSAISPVPCTSTTNPQNQAGSVTCDLGDIDAGHIVTIKIPVTAATPQNINDRVTVSSDSDDPDMTNNIAEDQVNVIESADLRLTKMCKPDGPVIVGENGTCTIFVDNLGPSDATNVVVTDTHLSDGSFTISSANASPGGPCGISSGVVTCNLGTEPAGGRTTITVIVTSASSVDVNDVASVKSDTTDPDNTNNIATGKVSFFTGLSDVVVTKTCKPLLAEGPYYVGSGANLPYCEITVTNFGPDPATNLVLTDSMIATANFNIDSQSANGVTCPSAVGGPYTQQTINCNAVASLAMNASISLKVVYSATRSVDINDSARVTTNSQDPDPNNNIANGQVKIVEQADLSATKVCKPDGAQLAGNTATCEIVVTNNGQSPARAVQLVDTLTSAGPFPYTVSSVTTTAGTCPTPASLPDTVNASPYQIICNLGDLTIGAKATVKVNVTSNNQVDINDVATANSTAVGPDVPTPDPNTANNTATGGVHFVALADLGLAKDGPDNVTAGTPMTYTLTVTNYGPSSAVNVVIKDILPVGVEIVSVSGTGGATCNAGTPGDATQPTTCQFNTIAPAGSQTMTIVVNVQPGTRGILHNDASVSSDTLDNSNLNNLASKDTTVEASADIVVVKTRTSAAPVIAGAEIDYQVIVRNDGPSTATGVVLTDTLPSWVTFVSSNPACVENPTGTLTCEIGTLQPGESMTVYITVLLDPSTPAGTLIVNTATASGNEFDPDTDSNTDSTSDESTTSADLWIDKVSNFPTGNPSGTILYNLYVYNKPGCELNSGSGNVDPADCWLNSGGPSDAQNVVVTDILPLVPKTFVVQYVSPNCTYDPISVPHRVVCIVADTNGNPIPLQAGAVAGPFQIQAVVRGSKGTFTNTATVTSTTFDPKLVNNTDVVKTTVQGSTGKRGGGR